MATPISVNPLARVSTAPSSPPSLRRRATAPESAPKNLSCPRCALSPPEWRESRRSLSFSLLLAHLILVSDHAIAGSFMDKYVKKKRLDPLEAYVPAVILSQLQIKDLERILEGEKPEFGMCRSLLRSGPAASLRVDIRAEVARIVGEILTKSCLEKGITKVAFDWCGYRHHGCVGGLPEASQEHGLQF